MVFTNLTSHILLKKFNDGKLPVCQFGTIRIRTTHGIQRSRFEIQFCHYLLDSEQVKYSWTNWS